MSNVRQLDFGDGDGGDEYVASDIRIIPIDNGYILEVDCDEGDIREAYLDKQELLTRLAEFL